MPLASARITSPVSTASETKTVMPLIEPPVGVRSGNALTPLLSVSIDPAFDRPAVLNAHAKKLGADPRLWRFVTAPHAELAAFGRQFGLDVRQTGSAPADIEHNLRTVVLDRNRRIVETRTGTGWTAADLLTTLRTVAGA